MSRLAALLTEIERKQNTVADLFKRSDDESDGNDSDATIAEIIKLNQEIEQDEIKAKELQDVESIRLKNDRRRDEFSRPVGAMRHPSGADGGATGTRSDAKAAVRSIGKLLLDDPTYKAWWSTIAPNNQAPTKVGYQFTSPSVALPDGFGLKDLITGVGQTSAGALVFPDIQAGFDPLGRRPLTIRDIITIGTTNSDSVEYVIETSETNNAAPVGEATSTSGSSGMAPESGLALAKVTTNVKSIEHWIPATTRALADAGQIQTLVDNFLTYGLAEEFEDQVMSGDGTGDNFTGIRNVSGVQSQPYDSNRLATLRKARTLVRVVGRDVPTAYVMHPYDWEIIDLLTDNEMRYYFGGPSVLGTPRLWGLPVVECEGVAQGEPIVGNWRRAVAWDREQTTIQSSNSHADFFLRGLVAILGAMRAAFGVIRPVAFVQIDITP